MESFKYLFNKQKSIKLIQKSLPICQNCHQSMMFYCLEIICANQPYYCIYCSTPNQYNPHFLHQFMSLKNHQKIQDQAKQALYHYNNTRNHINNLISKCDIEIYGKECQIRQLFSKKQELENRQKVVSIRIKQITKKMVALYKLINRTIQTNQNQQPYNLTIQKDVELIISGLKSNRINPFTEIEFITKLDDSIKDIVEEYSSENLDDYIKKLKLKLRHNEYQQTQYQQLILRREYYNQKVIKVVLNNKVAIQFLNSIRNIIRMEFNMFQGLQIYYKQNLKLQLETKIYKYAINDKLRIKQMDDHELIIEKQIKLGIHVYRIYKLHKSRFCRYPKSMKLQILQMFTNL